MKHFMIDINYLQPVEKLAEILPAHRAFLQTGYDMGLLLCSGPKNPKSGGIVIARAESLEILQDFFSQDPYQTNAVAAYTFVEFDPVKHQPFLSDWISD